jgi:DNA-binding response OmpR family regulator
MVAKILIVDDEESVRGVLRTILEREGYQVDTAADGHEALAKLREAPYDLLLLDLSMTPVDGLQVLRQARAFDEEMVVIVLTGYGSLESAVECLRLGAFDYLFKPASAQTIRQRVAEGLRHRQRRLQRHQLAAQIAALKEMLEQLSQEIEAAPQMHAKRFLQSGGLLMDLHHRTASLEGRSLALTTAEFEVLRCLVEASPEPLSPEALVQCALGYEAYPAEARELAKWHIHRLRRKIEQDDTPKHIKTIRQKGYLWVP